MRSFLFAGLLLLGAPMVSNAQISFIHGASQTLTVCENSSNNSFGDKLTITDPSFGAPVQWTIVGSPAGTLGGFPCNSFTDGGILTTASVFDPPSYTPAPGTYGTDVINVTVTDGTNTANITINVVILPPPSLVIGAIPAVCQGSSSTTISYSALANVGPTSAVFADSGGGVTSFVVPPNVDTINFDIQGASGGGDSHSGAPNPGYGGRVQGKLAVTPGHILNFYTGGMGANGSPSGAAGGFNGGGNAYYYFFACGGAGGGASDIRLDGTALTDRLVVAGGGGGNGWDSPGPFAGGAGGNQVAGNSAPNVGGSSAGGGNTTLLSGGMQATYVGWTPGSNGSYGQGGNGSVQGISGGGGGGYYGGGGGIWNGGGGGSSYASPTKVNSPVFTSGYNIGDGISSISYVIPGSYTIVWDTVAAFYGFVNDSAVLPSSPITVSLPATAPAGSYHGTLTIGNNTCNSSGYSFTVVINPTPDVDAVPNQTICNGDSTSTIFFTGTFPMATYNWTNSIPGIGMPANGSGDIPSFHVANGTPLPQDALITVTPLLNGCLGAPVNFTMLVNPTPSLTSTLTPPSICDSTAFSYVPGSATPGTTFFWARSTVYGIIDSPASGAGNPGEILYNNGPDSVTVPYVYTLDANGCANIETVNVTVYPRPVLSSPLSAPAICNNTVFSYTPASATTGVSFAWNRAIVPGISNAANSGTGNPLETLHNTTTAPVAVRYVYTLTANGCNYTQTVTVTVNPTATLTSTLSPAAVCDSNAFTYGPISATTGVVFTWSRAFNSGISNPLASGSGSVNEYLVNTTSHPINVTYNYTLTAYGCSNTQSVVVTINPKARLSSSLTPSVCDNTVFSYIPTSATTGTSFNWVRDTVTGISNGPGAGPGNPNETLINTTAHPIVVTYKYTMLANSCPSTQNVLLTVNPKPMLSSSLTPNALCDSAIFNYPPTSNTAGATFSWSRPYIAGIYAVAQSGVGNPNQQLINSTYVVVNVTYNFTITANGCSNKQNVVVAVNPTPKMNPPYVATVCSGSPFTYVPTSYTPGVTYAVNRPLVTNILAPTYFLPPGSNGVVHETLTDAVLVPLTTTYQFRLSVNGCTNLGYQALRVTVNPAPQVPQIVIYPTEFNPCNQTMYQNFGASTLQAPNVSYHWSATNATVYAEGMNNMNALISFDHPGTSVITLNSNVNGYGCTISSNSLTYNVGSTASNNPQVIYYNGQFICLTNASSSYQWGYDDAVTLDSTIISGQIDQSYTNGNPDFTDNHYWCMTKTPDGCLQKSYYNAPTGVTQIIPGTVDMKVYPNPASSIINVEINSSVVGKLSVEVVNMLGQKMATQEVDYHKTSIGVAEFPAGAYLLDCYRDGVKIATTRFIKN